MVGPNSNRLSVECPGGIRGTRDYPKEWICIGGRSPEGRYEEKNYYFHNPTSPSGALYTSAADIPPSHQKAQICTSSHHTGVRCSDFRASIFDLAAPGISPRPEAYQKRPHASNATYQIGPITKTRCRAVRLGNGVSRTSHVRRSRNSRSSGAEAHGLTPGHRRVAAEVPGKI